MPFDGSGGFDPLPPPIYPAIDGTTIESAQYNDSLEDIFQGFENCITRDGQSPATNNLPMGGNKLLNMAPASVYGEALVYNQTGASLADLTVTGALTVNGNTALGNAAADTLSVSGVVVKNATNNWNFAAPVSGYALTATAVDVVTPAAVLYDAGGVRAYATTVLDFSSQHIEGNANTISFSALTYNSGGGGGGAVVFERDISFGTSVSLWTNATTNAVYRAASRRLTVGPTGQVTIAAPASGIALAISGAASGVVNIADTTGRISGTALHNNASLPTGTTDQYVASGTYSPTAANYVNVQTTTPYATQWARVGNVVTVSGQIDVDTTTTGSAAFTLTLPIPSNFTGTGQLAGTGASGLNANDLNMKASASIAGDTAQFNFTASTTTSIPWSFIFMYEVR